VGIVSDGSLDTRKHGDHVDSLGAGTVDEPIAKRGRRPPRPPSAAVIAELDRQTTPTLIARAVKLAEWERSNLIVRGVEFPELAADQVASVLAQTREGRLTWDPQRCTLLQHVCAVFGARARRTLREKRECSFDALIDGAAGDGSGEDAERGHTTIEDALARSRTPELLPDAACDRVRVFKRFVAALGKLVVLRDDPEVTLAFEAWTRTGAIREIEVAEATGLSVERARRAVRVLRSLLDKQPRVLRAEIKEILT
jgi:hypothetical protein